MRVLLVEDAARTAAVLRRGMAEEGYSVDVVASGPDAVWYGTENPYDAIVLDVMLLASTGSRSAAGCVPPTGGRPSSC